MNNNNHSYKNHVVITTTRKAAIITVMVRIIQGRGNKDSHEVLPGSRRSLAGQFPSRSVRHETVLISKLLIGEHRISPG